ncbi:ROK family transcriptional regulator [Streptomyces sp. NPDC026672]|uniref:ROK family transcriptional regulator n=1 Tax=unclassified Streptomyces TaxID=2593676 RepID=UPI0033F19F30
MPASPSTARAINDRLALRLLQEEGPLTAGQLKQLTGLSRPTVADLVERLAAAGFITVVGESGEQRRGPNARLYGIVADRAHLAALDVRTESVSVLVSDLLGRVLAEASVPIGGDTGTGPAVEQAVTLVERVAKEAGADRLHTVGIGAPGLIDPATGELRDSGGLPAWHRRLVAALQERFPESRVTVENETNLAALAEQREGAARDRDTFVLLWLGHGTGAAVVLDGHLRRGASGGTGEIGFLPVPATSGLPAATDCEGGFHSLAGAAAIAALATAHGLPTDPNGDGPAAAAVLRAALTTMPTAPPAPSPTAPEGPSGAVGSRPGGAGHSAAGPVGSAARPAVSPAGPEVPGGGEVRSGGSTGLPDGVAESSEGPVRAAGGAADPAGPAGGSGGDGVFFGVSGEPPERGSGLRESSEVLAGGVEGGAVPSGGAERGFGGIGAGVDAVRARAFLDEFAERVAIGVASVVAVLDPGCVVLGGEVGEAGGEALAALVGARVRRMSPLRTEVRAGGLGGAAVLRGALLTARERAQEELFAPPER